MLLRPSTSKLLTRNAGPFLVVCVALPHVWLRSLTHALELKENVKNVRPLRLLLSDEAAAQMERRAAQLMLAWESGCLRTGTVLWPGGRCWHGCYQAGGTSIGRGAAEHLHGAAALGVAEQ